MDIKEFARLGGLARAAKMTRKQRIESARKAGKAGKGIPKRKTLTTPPGSDNL